MSLGKTSMLVTDHGPSLDEPTTTVIGMLIYFEKKVQENKKTKKEKSEVERPRALQSAARLAAQLAPKASKLHITCIAEYSALTRVEY
jgi:hypothetical protein